ncbi:hypothetical protein LTR28_008823, partial [Elasticomyces elasticus]
MHRIRVRRCTGHRPRPNLRDPEPELDKIPHDEKEEDRRDGDADDGACDSAGANDSDHAVVSREAPDSSKAQSKLPSQSTTCRLR